MPCANDVLAVLADHRRRHCARARTRARRAMRDFVRENGLSLFFAAIFSLTIVAQSFAGQHAFNADQAAHGGGAVLVVALRALLRLRRGRDGELAVGVPPVHAVHPRHGLARPEGVERVEAARAGWAGVGASGSGSGAGPLKTLRRGPRLAAVVAGSTRTRSCSRCPRSSCSRGSRSPSTTGGSSTRCSASTEQSSVSWGEYVSSAGLLGANAPELAVGVSRRRNDGRLHDLPAPTRVARVETGRRAPRRDGFFGLTEGRSAGRGPSGVQSSVAAAFLAAAVARVGELCRMRHPGVIGRRVQADELRADRRLRRLRAGRRRQHPR